MITDIADNNIFDRIISKEALEQSLNTVNLQNLFLFKHIVKDFDKIFSRSTTPAVECLLEHK